MKTSDIRQVLGDKALVRLLKKELKSESGLIIPDVVINNHLSQLAEVVKLGTGKLHDQNRIEPWDIKEGDIVAVVAWSNRMHKFEDEEMYEVYMHEILGTVTGIQAEEFA